MEDLFRNTGITTLNTLCKYNIVACFVLVARAKAVKGIVSVGTKRICIVIGIRIHYYCCLIGGVCMSRQSDWSRCVDNQSWASDGYRCFASIQK